MTFGLVTNPAQGWLRILLTSARIAIAVGAAVSVGALLRASRQTPVLLRTLLALWVLAPFAGLALADVLSRRWPVATRVAMCVVALAVAICSIVILSNGSFRPAGKPAGFLFVVVPGAELLVIAVSLGIIVWRVRK